MPQVNSLHGSPAGRWQGATVDNEHRMTPATIKAFWARGWNNKQIAEYYGITPQAVSDMARRYNLYKGNPRKRVKEVFPWKVRDEHRLAAPNKRLRDHAEYFFSGGDGMSDYKLYRLANFYRRLMEENLVITYEPDYVPENVSSFTHDPGRVSNGGWRWLPRTEEDEDFIIRFNEYCLELSEEAREVWRFPEEIPDVRRPY